MFTGNLTYYIYLIINLISKVVCEHRVQSALYETRYERMVVNWGYINKTELNIKTVGSNNLV